MKAVLKRSEKRDGGTQRHSASTGVTRPRRRDVQGHEARARKSASPRPSSRSFSPLATAPQRIFTRGELVEKALGYQFEGYERSVDAHVKNIRRKLDDDPQKPPCSPDGLRCRLPILGKQGCFKSLHLKFLLCCSGSWRWPSRAPSSSGIDAPRFPRLSRGGGRGQGLFDPRPLRGGLRAGYRMGRERRQQCAVWSMARFRSEASG